MTNKIVPFEYDLIILDEIESLLNHFNSSTIVDQRSVFNIFHALCLKSKKILALDSDFDNRSYEYLNTLDKDKNMIIVKNIFVPSIKNSYFLKIKKNLTNRLINY
jgi:hypothetical protein